MCTLCAILTEKMGVFVYFWCDFGQKMGVFVIVYFYVCFFFKMGVFVGVLNLLYLYELRSDASEFETSPNVAR